MNLKEYHPSWIPVLTKLRHEPLNQFLNDILPNESYFPKGDSYLDAFKYPLDNFRVVFLKKEPTYRLEDLYRVDLEDTNENGVFLYNLIVTSPTSRNANKHEMYWEDFSKKFLLSMSIRNPCIWVYETEKLEDYPKYILNTEDFRDYSPKELEKAPISPYNNYIFNVKDKDLEEKINLILKKNYKQEVPWEVIKKLKEIY